MPLVYACICPRAPDDAPPIGDALRTVGEELMAHRPDTVIIVDASGVPGQAIGVLISREASVGGRAHDADHELSERVIERANAAALPVETLRGWDGDIDVGCALPEDARIVPIAVARLEPRFHFELGRALGGALEGEERRVAIACVVELSRALREPAVRIFNQHYRRAIEAWHVKWLVGLDTDVRRRAGEDAVAQTALLMGALSAYRIQPRMLAYEASEDSGQLVAAIDVVGARRKREIKGATIGAGNGPTTEAR